MARSQPPHDMREGQLLHTKGREAMVAQLVSRHCQDHSTVTPMAEFINEDVDMVTKQAKIAQPTYPTLGEQRLLRRARITPTHHHTP